MNVEIIRITLTSTDCRQQEKCLHFHPGFLYYNEVCAGRPATVPQVDREGETFVYLKSCGKLIVGTTGIVYDWKRRNSGD